MDAVTVVTVVTVPSPLIRAARMDAEPLLLGARPRLPSVPAPAPALPPRAAPPRAAQSPAVGGAHTNPAAEAGVAGAAANATNSATNSASPSAAQDTAQHLAEQDRQLRESISAERQRVLERAREQGHQAGVAQGRAEFDAQLGALRQLLGSAHDALAAGVQGSEPLMVEIAFEAVAKILGEAMAQREGVLAAVREVVRGVREREHLVVRVSPRDHPLLSAEGILPNNGDAHRMELVADERVALGGCLIETGGGTLDGRLETQLKRLCETLAGAGRAPAPEGLA